MENILPHLNAMRPPKPQGRKIPRSREILLEFVNRAVPLRDEFSPANLMSRKQSPKQTANSGVICQLLKQQVLLKSVARARSRCSLQAPTTDARQSKSSNSAAVATRLKTSIEGTHKLQRLQVYLQDLRRSGEAVLRKKQEQWPDSLITQKNQNKAEIFSRSGRKLLLQKQNSAQKAEDEEQTLQTAIKKIFPQQRLFQKQRLQVGEATHNKILSVRYDPQDMYVAVASSDGVVRVLGVEHCEWEASLQLSEKNQVHSMGVSQDRSCLEENSAVSVVPAAAPCTCVRWHPSQARPNSVLATYTTGQILLWRTDLQRVVERWSEHDNNITTCDFNARGEHFVTCGYDATVRVYDVERSGVHGTLRGGSIAAHTNRIYACKFLPQDSNVLLTAGWDRTLLLWDLRAGQAQAFLHGPLVCGDSLDVKNNLVLTGSWRTDSQLQTWDLRRLQKHIDLPWERFNLANNKGPDQRGQAKGKNKTLTSDTPNSPTAGEGKPFIYACQFSKLPYSDCLLAGTTGTYELRLFDGHQCCDLFREELSQGVTTLDFAHSKHSAIFGCSDGTLFQVEVL